MAYQLQDLGQDQAAPPQTLPQTPRTTSQFLRYRIGRRPVAPMKFFSMPTKTAGWKTALIVGGSVAALGGLGFLGWKLYKRRKTAAA